MEFVYNNLSYWFKDSESLADMLLREDVLNFPMDVWIRLLKEKFKTYSKEVLIEILEAKIKHYDTSNEVNGFFIHGSKMWLDKTTRMGLMNLVNCSSESVELMLGNTILTFKIEQAKQFLKDLEVYAGKCYLQTQKHLLAIKQLNTIDEILNYDYTTGYPDKIVLE